MNREESAQLAAGTVRLQSERRPDSVNPKTPPQITLRPITENDMEFLFRLYASTRAEEKALVGWGDGEWDDFLRMQFDLQHSQYMRNYPHPSFDIIMQVHTPVGRLYVNRGYEEIRIIDISLSPEYRGRGIAASLMGKILREGDARGVPVTLHVERNNPALALYRRLGFQMEDSADVYCFMRRPPVQADAHTGYRDNGSGEGRI
jgi:ribosomal protein S18 acetylase RimI-like enzyme